MASVSGLPNSTEENRAWIFCDDANQATVRFRLLSVVGLGVEELRGGYDEDAVIPGDTYSGPGAPLGGYVWEVSGNRRLTFSVLVECARQDLTAHLFAERIRTRLRLPSSMAALRALELGLNSIGASTDRPYEHDGREISYATFDVVFNAADSATDAPVTTIEEPEFAVTVTE